MYIGGDSSQKVNKEQVAIRLPRLRLRHAHPATQAVAASVSPLVARRTALLIATGMGMHQLFAPLLVAAATASDVVTCPGEGPRYGDFKCVRSNRASIRVPNA